MCEVQINVQIKVQSVTLEKNKRNSLRTKGTAKEQHRKSRLLLTAVDCSYSIYISSMKLLSKLAPVKCFVTSTLMMQSAQILQPEPLTPYMGAEFQPLQSIVCVGILIFFGLVQLKIRAADSLSDEIRVLEANKKKASISLLSGLGTPTDLEEIDLTNSLFPQFTYCLLVFRVIGKFLPLDLLAMIASFKRKGDWNCQFHSLIFPLAFHRVAQYAHQVPTLVVFWGDA